MSESKLIQVPASTSNLGPGYDTLGLALNLYLRVEVRPNSGPCPAFAMEGEGAADLPPLKDSLIIRVMQYAFQQEGHHPPSLDLRVQNEIPVARGLGSSAAAIVAGIGIYEALSGVELSPEKFFSYALAFESHPDNLTPCRFGGFTVSGVSARNHAAFYRAEVSRQLKVQLVVPDIKLSTRNARAVIQPRLSIQDAVFNLQRSSLVVAALLRDEFHLLREGLRDRLHQPPRARLIPGLLEILALNDADVPGLWGVCLSGAGPSILVFADFNLDGIYAAIAEIFARHEVRCRLFDLEADNQGRKIC